jgi:hypothetical protein
MIIPQRFLKGKAGTFKFLPHFGRPDAAPNIILYEPDGTELQASAATTMATATTTDATAPDASNDRLMSVTATSSFSVGDVAYAINNLSQIEYPIVSGIDSSGENLYFDRDLVNTYANGDTVAKHECTYALTTTHTATSGKYYSALVQYDVNSVTYYERIPFHVRNRVFQSRLRTQDLYDVFPDLDQSLVDKSYDKQIAAAFDRIYMDLESIGIDLDKFRGGFFEQAHLYRTMVIVGERWILNQAGIEEWYSVMVDRYNELFEKLTDRITYYDSDDDGVADTAEHRHETGYNARPGSFLEANPLGWDDDQIKAEDDDYEQY